MRAMLPIVGAMLAMASRAPVPAECATAGCFVGDMTGASPSHLTGRAAFHESADGSLTIILAVSGDSATRTTIVISRPRSTGAAGGDVLSIHEPSCEGDDTPPQEDEDAPPAPKSTVSLTVRGGPPLLPVWLASGQSGTVSLSPSASGLISGHFEVRACGTDADNEDVVVTLKGTFKARRMKA